jgi:hypothetical protein
MRRRTRLRWPMAVVAAFGLAACGSGSDPKEPVVAQTLAQVSAAADQAVQGAATAAGVTAHVRSNSDHAVGITTCITSNAAAHDGLVQVNRFFFVDGPFSADARSKGCSIAGVPTDGPSQTRSAPTKPTSWI